MEVFGGMELFGALASQPAHMAVLAKAALSRGTDRFAEGDLDGAVREFQRAVALDPTPENAEQAFALIAQTRLQQEQPDEAIAAYRKAMTMSPASAGPHLGLGNVYFSLGRFAEARAEYTLALRADPTDSTAVFSLGQAAMAAGDLHEAESRFRYFIAANPNNHGGYHALGQVYLKQDRAKDAIAMLEQALNLKHDFAAARVDLGSAHADLGEWGEANRQLQFLEEADGRLADLLSGYLTQKEQPRLLAAYSGLTFNFAAAAHTPVATLTPALAAPNAATTLEMKFLFSKEMDSRSVQDLGQWAITRAPLSAPGGGYNWGLPVPATEASVSPRPLSVVYDADSLTATVFFVVRQNAAGDATIDPQHLVCRFRGVDAYANAMDSAADEFSGISRIS